MKRLFSYFAAFATMFAIASCQEEIAQPDVLVDGDSKTVTFSVEAPTLPQTKAFGDGTQDLKLLCAVYVGAGNTIGTPVGTFLGGKFEAEEEFLLPGGVAPQIVPGTTEDGMRKWDVTITLVKNFKYDIVFWAQTVPAKGLSPYTFVPEDAQIVATYAGDANDESRDAFYFLCDDYNVMNPTDSKVPLVRPFAQINLGAADYDALTHLGITDLTSAISSAKATATVPNTLNLLDGSVEGAEEVSFVKTAAPVGEETAKNTIVIGTGADAKTFRLVGMNYILADVKTANPTVDLAMNFNYNNVDLDIDVPSVPYARNYKTNIVGNFFTDDAEFEVVIAPMFEKEDEIYNTDLTLAEAFEVERDVTIVLKEDQVISEPLILDKGNNVTINLNGYKITSTAKVGADGDGNITTGDSDCYVFVVKDGTLNIQGDGEVAALGGTSYDMAVWALGGTVNIEGGRFTNLGQENDGCDVIYVKNDAVVNIYGGSFEAGNVNKSSFADKTNGVYAALNLHGSATGAINVYGGEFVNFDPTNPGTESPAWNTAHPNGFLADGYKVNMEEKDGKKYYTVVELNEIEKAISTGQPSVTLTEDLNLEGTITVPAGQFTIDLGGKALTSTASPAVLANGELTIKNGNVSVDGEFVRVGDAAKVTLEGVKATSGTAESKGDNCLFIPKESKNTVVTVDAASELTTYRAAVIQSNGNTEGLVLNVNGKVTSVGEVAIYLPQVAECTVGATADISGVTGIEIRAGKLTVEDGAKVSATENTLTAQKNGNGSTVIGAAIAVSPHTTNLPIDVTINGGEFGCAYSLYENYLQDEERTAKTTLAVTGGTFKAPIYSENCEDFITGGTFAEGVEVPETYIHDNYAIKDGVISKMYTTVAEFLAAAEDETVYTLSGTITSVANTTFGNFDLTDDTGTVYIYGLCSPEGVQKYWAESGAKLGDDIVIKTVRTSFNNSPQGENAIFVSLASPGTRPFMDLSKTTVSFTAAGGSENVDLAVYNWTEEVKVTSDNEQFSASYSEGKLTIIAKENNTEAQIKGTITISVGNETETVNVTQAVKSTGESTTIEVVFSELGYANAASVAGKSIVKDDVTFVFAQGGSSTAPAYYTSGEAIRMYQNGATLDVSAGGSVISSIEITFADNQYYIAADSGEFTEEAEVRTWSGEAINVKFTSTGTDKNHRAYVQAIKVTYK